MSASLTDKITDVRNGARPNSARVTVARSIGGTNLACDSLAGWATASKVHFVTYQLDTNSNPVPGTQLDCYGIVSANSITQMTILDGTDGGNSVGDVVEMLPTAGWGQDLADALTTTLNRDGTLQTGIVTTSKIADSGVTTVKIADSNVTTAKIADSSVTNAKLAGSITSDKIIGQDKSVLSTDSNPYKFLAYRNAAYNWGSNAAAKITFDTEVYDTNNNFASGKYTAPVNGFYFFYSEAAASTVSGSGIYIALYKNGSQYMAGDGGVPVGYTGSFGTRLGVTGLLQLTAGDYVEVYVYGGNNTGATGLISTYFGGFLMSRT